MKILIKRNTPLKIYKFQQFTILLIISGLTFFKINDEKSQMFNLLVFIPDKNMVSLFKLLD